MSPNMLNINPKWNVVPYHQGMQGQVACIHTETNSKIEKGKSAYNTSDPQLEIKIENLLNFNTPTDNPTKDNLELNKYKLDEKIELTNQIMDKSPIGYSAHNYQKASVFLFFTQYFKTYINKCKQMSIKRLIFFFIKASNGHFDWG
jgi:hypothetical protein